MTLENLLAIHRLVAHEPSRESITKLLTAAARNITDAKVMSISGENRFDAAYKAIMQCAMAALWANGYRTSTSQPGHHQTAIQALPKTIGLDNDTVSCWMLCASNAMFQIMRVTRSAMGRWMHALKMPTCFIKEFLAG